MTPALRQKVILRDMELAEDAGVVFCCPVPGCDFEFVLGAEDPNIEVDHEVPLSKGGTDDEENLRCYCRSCNRSKSCYREANPNRKTVARKVLCACGRFFYMSDFDYAVSIDLVKTASASCEACAPLLPDERPPPREPRKARKPKPGRELPEGFEPARATFRKLGL